MSEPNQDRRDAAFLAQFTEVTDETILSAAEKNYVALHRKGSFRNGKLGWKADGSLNLYGFDEGGPICAPIRLPTDPDALAKLEAEERAILENLRKARRA